MMRCLSCKLSNATICVVVYLLAQSLISWMSPTTWTGPSLFRPTKAHLPRHRQGMYGRDVAVMFFKQDFEVDSDV